MLSSNRSSNHIFLTNYGNFDIWTKIYVHTWPPDTTKRPMFSSASLSASKDSSCNVGGSCDMNFNVKAAFVVHSK